MNTIQKLILSTFFLIANAYAQEIKLKDNGSIGVDFGLMNRISSSSDALTEQTIYLHYTKQINHLLGLRGGFVNGSIPDEELGNDFNGLRANGILNLSNLSPGSAGSTFNSILYLTAGGQVLNTKKEGKELIASFGGGWKYAIKGKDQNIDLDVSYEIGLQPTSDANNIFSMFGLGINYRFNKKEEALEWSNPLDAVYKDLAELRTKIDSTEDLKWEALGKKMKIQDGQINNNKRDLNSILSLSKRNRSQIESWNKQINVINQEEAPKLIESNSPKELRIGFHLIAGSFLDQSKEKKLVSELQSEAYESTKIQESENGLFRVVVQSYKNRKEALEEMEKMKKAGRLVWLLE